MLKIITGENAKYVNVVEFPDAKMHPSNFLEYCKKLVLLGKSFNITVLTFNPALIESIDALKDYYNVEVEYYLNNKRIDECVLYKLYDNLGNIYHQIDLIRLRTKFREDEVEGI